MTSGKINVNTTDINSTGDSLATMPADENWNRAWRLHKEA